MRRRWRLASVTVVLVGCAGTTDADRAQGPAPTATVTPPAPAPPAPAAPSTTTDARPSDAAPAWSGAWGSAACGERAYERWLTLEPDGTARGQERVSPCPPGAACVWSGVVDWTGTWEARPGGITLRASMPPKPAAKPLPETLDWNGSVLVETQASQRCDYTRRAPPQMPPRQEEP